MQCSDCFQLIIEESIDSLTRNKPRYKTINDVHYEDIGLIKKTAVNLFQEYFRV